MSEAEPAEQPIVDQPAPRPTHIDEVMALRLWAYQLEAARIEESRQRRKLEQAIDDARLADVAKQQTDALAAAVIKYGVNTERDQIALPSGRIQWAE